jgi:hypothetical protein
MAGYVFPFDRLNLDCVPIRGFTRSAGSVDFVVEIFCPAGAQADRMNKRNNNNLMIKK